MEIVGIPCVSMPLTKENGLFLKNFLKKYWKSNKDSSKEEIELEEFEEFISILGKKRALLEDYHRKNKKLLEGDPTKVALLYENAQAQKKISDANKSLKIATWILAIATLGILIGTFYGVHELNKVISIGLQFLVGILALYLIWEILKGLIKGFKFLAKLFK